MRFYIDTCIWIDFIEDRTEDDFLVRCVQDEHTVLVSEFLLTELFGQISPEYLRTIMTMLESKELLIKITISQDQDIEAKYLSNSRNLPFGDALHAILSRDNDAVLVTRDKHFLKLKDICNIELL